MNPTQISVNLYSQRERLKTPQDFAAGMKRLAEIGFKSVQLSGVDFEMMSEADFVRVCGDSGITITATHLIGTDDLDAPQKCIDRLGKLGVTQDAYAYPAGVNFGEQDSIDRWLVKLEAANQAYKKAGITLSYHNHHLEFIKSRGKTVQQRIFDETTLAFEIDTYWVQAGGESPLTWVKKCAEAGRLPLLHLKDFRIGIDATTGGAVAQFAELGAGGIEFAPIIAAAEANGCLSYIIEQDNAYGRDEFEAAAESFGYLRDNFVR
ncbi:hypothetical protein AXK11_09110 [Cephaloticoccus primus]|uniref:Xylose isomerase-like TIM barrel domain-containing protein n=1 Tax=Cephaloticoccus primus TaxID=1548207 RepID=A0A139SHM2_9BACT|nr:sugar phosphate isomerase/epimerase [Cephaloticoccus primus]KXU34075.1 hypothetical protein AXK11_09110 [Cephaloticoccus primus]